jgi:hypothetical protein
MNILNESSALHDGNPVEGRPQRSAVVRAESDEATLMSSEACSKHLSMMGYPAEMQNLLVLSLAARLLCLT